MFKQILFLIIILLLISFSPQPDHRPWLQSNFLAFLIGFSLYGASLGLIILQNRLFASALKRSRDRMLTSANIYLILWTTVFLFGFTSQRIIPGPSFSTALYILLSYYFGLYVFHYTAYPSIPAGSRGIVSSPSHYAFNQLRLLLPFCIPYLLFTLLIDLFLGLASTELKDWILLQQENPYGTVIMFTILVIFLILIVLFFPPFTVKIWKCRDLNPSELTQKLHQLCNKAGFKHAGMKTWTILNHSYTAGIVGVLPRFRYVMFTKRLLDDLSPRAIVAILAHEIGHSARKHLLIYPLIIIGMIVLTGLFSNLIGPSIEEWFAIKSLISPSPIWEMSYPLAILIPHVIIILVYFRFIFGYFSRLFERQADLHIYTLNVPAEDMQVALDELGHMTGGTHLIPCWHHFSIQKRIDFLEKTKLDSALIDKHHRFVKLNVIGYFILLLLGCVVLFSPTNPLSQSISDTINFNNHSQHTKELIFQYKLPSHDRKIYNALFSSVQQWARYKPQSIVELSAADTLFNNGEVTQAAQLMRAAWQTTNVEELSPDLLREFTLLTEEILRKSSGQPKQQLERAYQHAIQRYHSNKKTL